MRIFDYLLYGSITIILLGCGKTQNNIESSTSPTKTFEISESPSYQKIGKLKLSEYGFFKGELAELIPVENVQLYDIKSPLFTDYALKKRFISLPEGSNISVSDDQDLEFPVGTVLIKNFYYENSQLAQGNGRIIETRLLIHEEDGWKALPYIWNLEQTEAYLEIAGGNFPFQLKNASQPFDYSVPTMTQCKSCHEKNGEIQPIGPSVRQINKTIIVEGEEKNQLENLHAIGWMKEKPNITQIAQFVDYQNKNAPLNKRARAYLDVNCAHCHRPEGPAKNSGLNLRYDNEDPFSLGINKAPIAAGKGSGGLLYDIVAGKPDESILLFRMKSNDPGIMMPELGRHMPHQEGLELIREWIKSM